MRALIDQNLPRRLVKSLDDIFSNSAHVAQLQLDKADDQQIWKIAKTEGYVLVSKDNDFAAKVVMEGPPPKVIWLRVGNCSTAELEGVLRDNREAIAEFLEISERGLLVIPPGLSG